MKFYDFLCTQNIQFYRKATTIIINNRGCKNMIVLTKVIAENFQTLYNC